VSPIRRWLARQMIAFWCRVHHYPGGGRRCTMLPCAICVEVTYNITWWTIWAREGRVTYR
jgi:hypothetical protein